MVVSPVEECDRSPGDAIEKEPRWEVVCYEKGLDRGGRASASMGGNAVLMIANEYCTIP